MRNPERGQVVGDQGPTMSKAQSEMILDATLKKAELRRLMRGDHQPGSLISGHEAFIKTNVIYDGKALGVDLLPEELI